MKKTRVFADPTVDFAFKRIFGTEKYKAATIGLLNSIIEGVNIVDVEFLNTELGRENADDKNCIIDVLAADRNGNRYIVEMQNAKQPTFLQRMVYYTSKVIAHLDGEVGVLEYNLRSTYAIAFLNFNAEAITEISGRYHLHYRTTEVKCHNKLPSSPEYHFFDLKEFARIFRKSSGEITNGTDYWLYLLTGSKEMDGMPGWAEGDKAYEAYFEASAVASFTPQETIKYDKDMMTERDRINSINYARQEGEQKGLRKGLREGRKEGREEGLQEGERKGKAEGKAESQREIALAFKAKGVDAGMIAACTGLSLDEVAKL
jgi:predicted transposase/invertase (TIGR01784 family)